MNIIEQIRAEVERRYNKHKQSNAITENVYAEEDKSILSFLDTLQEKSEKPTNPKEQHFGPPNWYPHPLEEQPVCLYDGGTTSKEKCGKCSTTCSVRVEQPVCENDRIRRELIVHLEQEANSATLDVNRKRWKEMLDYVKCLNTQPVCEELEEHIRNVWEDDPHAQWAKCPFVEFQAIARHFAKWGAEYIKKHTYQQNTQNYSGG